MRYLHKMSVILPHSLHTAHVACALGTLLVAGSACSGSLSSDANGLGPGAGNDFGAETDVFDRDAGLEDAGALDASSPDPGTTSLRFVHGIVNLGPLHICHLPNFVGKGNPAEDERGAYALPFSASFGEVTNFESVASLNTGALSLHVEPAPVVDADAGVDDAGVELADAGSELDAGPDASLGGEFPPDGAEPAPCTRETRITLLSLGKNQTKGTAPAEAAHATPAARTLIASGVALDPQRLAQRRDELEAQYLEGAPDEFAAAETFAQREVEKLIATYGPKLTLAEEPVAPVESESFTLALTHVVPDVLTSSYGPGPGGIRLCVTTGTLENPVEPPVREAPFQFRSQTQLASTFSQNVSYRFRVFSAARFDASDTPALYQDCATTGVVQLAELSVNGETLKAARAHNLLFIGSVAPASLCAPVDPQAVIQAGCPYSIEQLTPRLVLLPAY